MNQRHRQTTQRFSLIQLNFSCTNLDPNATRRHIRAAFDAGATREEILLVFFMVAEL
jgi:alkylhydroperoxidase/carboxymuconolactone decarboxylase family protein YurZ